MTGPVEEETPAVAGRVPRRQPWRERGNRESLTERRWREFDREEIERERESREFDRESRWREFEREEIERV